MTYRLSSQSMTERFYTWKRLSKAIGTTVEETYVKIMDSNSIMETYKEMLKLMKVSDVDAIISLWIDQSADNALQAVSMELRLPMDTVLR